MLLVVFSLLLWWTYWNYRSITEWTFLLFVLYLSPVVAFYFLSAIAFPNPGEAVVDLQKYYFANRVGFFGTFAIYAVLAGVAAMVVRKMPLMDPSNAFRLGMLALMLMLMRSASERVHTVLFVLATALMAAFIVLFQFRLA